MDSLFVAHIEPLWTVNKNPKSKILIIIITLQQLKTKILKKRLLITRASFDELRTFEHVFASFCGMYYILQSQVVPHITALVVSEFTKLKKVTFLLERVFVEHESNRFNTRLYLLLDHEYCKGMPLPRRAMSRSKTSL